MLHKTASFKFSWVYDLNLFWVCANKQNKVKIARKICTSYEMRFWKFVKVLACIGLTEKQQFKLCLMNARQTVSILWQPISGDFRRISYFSIHRHKY